MEFKGKVKKVFERTFAKKDGSGNITTHEIWVEEDCYQPQSGIFEVGRDAPVPNEGEMVTIQFGMSTNEWNDRVFGKNRAWKIESERLDNTPVGKIVQKQEASTQPETVQPADGGGSEALPF